MLLDELFSAVSLTKKAWVRRDGNLKLVTKKIASPDLSKTEKPLFPISKPRYGPKPNDNGIGYKSE